MTTISFDELLRKGGGHVYYIWNVSGYPWCVTNHPDVVTCFNSGTANALAHRSTVFGGNDISNACPVYDETVFPIFATLQKMGTQSFESRDTEGVLSGGDYQIEIADLNLGHEWIKWGIANPQLLVDSNMEDVGTAAWTAGNGATLSKESGDPHWGNASLRVARNALDSPYAYQTILTNGVTYKVTGWAKGDGTNAPKVRLNTTLVWEGTSSTSWQRIDGIGVSDGTQLRLRCPAVGAGYCEFDDIEVYAANGDQYHGLPGVHSMAYERIDPNVGWGYISTPFMRGDYTLYVAHKDGGKLEDYMAEPWRLLWVGQECIAVVGCTESNGILTISVIERGMLRTREQDHFTENYCDINPVCKDTPGSIKDFPCWMWAVVLNEAHTDFLTSTPYLIRPAGKVLNATTKNGITKISIGSPFMHIDKDYVLPRWEGHLARYVFSRHEDSGTTFNSVNANCECPHVVIREFVDKDDDTGTENYLWLCAPGDSITFDTWWDVLQAIYAEIRYCMDGSTDQMSGTNAVPGDDFEYVTLTKEYELDAAWHISCAEVGGGSCEQVSLLSGPCAWLFDLGLYWSPTTGMATLSVAHEACNQPLPWFYFSKRVCTSNDSTNYWKLLWMICSYPPGNNWPVNYPATQLEGGEYQYTRYAQYFYGWEWSDADIAGGFDGLNNDNKSNYFKTGDYLYLQIGTDISGISNGDVIHLGNTQDNNSLYYPPSAAARFAMLTVNSSGTSGNYPYLDIDDAGTTTVELVPGYQSPFRVGVGLTYMPFWEQERSVEQINMSAYEMVFEDSDPWKLSFQCKGANPNFAGIFRGLLGESGTNIVPLADGQQLSHVVGFITDSYTTGIIDWDSMVRAARAAKDALNSFYLLNITDKVNILKMLQAEMLLHGIAPTWEYQQAYQMFRMGCREIGTSNISEAHTENRVLTESELEIGHTPEESHNSQPLANAADIKLNYNGDKHMMEISVDTHSAHIQGSSEASKLSISSFLTHIKQRDEAWKWFGNLVRQMGTPVITQTAPCTMSVMTGLAIGKGFLLTDGSTRIPYTHALGMDEYPGQVTRMSYDLDSNKINVSYRLFPYYTYGWAPACLVDANNSTKAGSGVINCTSELHEFTSSMSMIDCMYFDCYVFNLSTLSYSAKGCSCGNYAVIAIELDTTTQVFMRFDVTSVAANGTIQLTDQSNPTNYDLWDTTKRHVIFFDTWDNCEDCQKKWLFFCDSGGYLGSGNDPGMRWI